MVDTPEKPKTRSVRAIIRNRISEGVHDRRSFRRTVHNVVEREGTAFWLNENIKLMFCEIGYAKLPGDEGSLSMCAMEVIPNGRRIGWVRIDPETVTYTDVEG